MKNFFSHDEGARNDPKLIKVLMRLGQAGKGVYWDLIEMLYEQDGYLKLSECESYAFALRTEYALIESLINDFGLFENDGKIFWSDSALRRLEIRKSKSQKASESAQKRWGNANAMRTHNDGNAIKGKEIKREESKVKLSKVKEEGKEEGSDESSLPPTIDFFDEIFQGQKIPVVDSSGKPVKKAPHAGREVFRPPHLDEVKAKFLELTGNAENEAFDFYHYYQANGWIVGKTKMKDWISAAHQWISRSKKWQKNERNTQVKPASNLSPNGYEPTRGKRAGKL